jgi:L-alanine-DL-glutamate epimerase-like enolase superfamily enzyme
VARGGYFEIPDKPGLGVELKEGLEELYPPLAGDCFRADPEARQ